MLLWDVTKKPPGSKKWDARPKKRTSTEIKLDGEGLNCNPNERNKC